MITTVLFDLDGTLLPMDNDAFTKGYFKLLAAKLAPHGYEPRQLVDAIWAGTAAMVQNDGRETNEAAFWKRFAGIYGDKVLAFCRRWIHWPLASGACKMMNGITACW